MTKNRRPEENFVAHIINQELDDNDFLHEIIPAGKLSSLEALNLYRGDYNARLEEALQNKYEAVYLIAGEELFSDLAQIFLNTHKSTDPDLQKFGDEFPNWLETTAPLNDSMSFLSEVAKIDLTFHKIFHMDRLEKQQQLQPTPENIYLKSNSPLILVQVSSSGYSVWSLRHETELPSDFEWNKEEHLLIYKTSQRTIHSIVLEPPIFNFINKMVQGRSLLSALNDLGQEVTLDSESNYFKMYQMLMEIFQANNFLENK